MTLVFEDVKIDHIGRGGLEDDVALVDLAEDEIREVCRLVNHDLYADKGSVTIKIDVRKTEGGDVIVAGGVKTAPPARRIKGLSARVTDRGEVLTATHKQEPLPLLEENERVTPLRKES